MSAPSHRPATAGGEVYHDNNATTRPRQEVRAAVHALLTSFPGNASSAHASGDRARDSLERARDQVAALLGGDPAQLVFTSSGTEANNMVLAAVAAGDLPARIVTTAVEHPSVLTMCAHLAGCGVEVLRLPVDRDGQVALAELEAALVAGPALVSIQWVNSETGVVQPVAAIGELCARYGARFHTDAAQATGKLRFEVAALPVDYLTFTAHKFHGLQGTGGVWVRPGCDLRPALFGGDQESGLRAGTENLPGIVAAGVAAHRRRQRLEQERDRMRSLRDRFEAALLATGDVAVNGGGSDRVCNTSNLRFRGVDGQALVARLDQAGLRCSQSSACSNRRPEPSHVLRAMGLSEAEAYASVRFSFAYDNTMAEVERASAQIRDLCGRLRRFAARPTAAAAARVAV